MTSNQIIEEVYKSQWLKDVIEKMNPEDLRQDLKQEAILVLLELEADRVEDMYTNGMLKYFTIRTILNMIKSDRSKFFMMYRNYQEINLNENLTEDIYKEVEVDIHKIFGNTREQLYEKDMLFHYCYSFDSNALAMSKAIGIPYKTVIRTLNNAKTKAKCYLKSQHQ